MIAQREFLLGEEKYIDFQVLSTIAQTIEITSATFILSKSGATDVTGDCVIDGDKISVLLEPIATGTYVLEVTYLIGLETRKIKVNVVVT